MISVGINTSSGNDSRTSHVQVDEQQYEKYDLKSLEDDPALLDCCLQDLEEERNAREMFSRLMATDLSNKRLEYAAQVFATDISQARQVPGYVSDAGTPELTSDEDSDDPEMLRLKQERLMQLQKEARMKSSLQKTGRGRLQDEDEARLASRLLSEDGFVVVHLSLPEKQVCAAVDEHLNTLAGHHMGTLFLRVAANRTAGASARHQWALHSLPALLCVRDGAMRARASVAEFCSADNGELFEEDVTAWLVRLRALRGLSGEANLLEDEGSSGSEEEEEKHQPCPECGRTYPHEHVRPLARAAESDEENGGT
uniref:Phosducin thioredoxin-like domain-containing protein n=1 Tax=Tetraselmis sp. GSL018 TaxID=582737 RepID=A0A061R5F2_9CHLO|mmetsp:Transcript_30301/g.72098  ORF Transcript_30301/g.72098 Transcript_30301/m.72098 type:complete len:312 (-) Transcript_30301:169-1104(-)|eukprot:CAMPEP_0177603114 /NCGR_PEP_ID=MMETSP0419_2-20121207/15312_1 /TAXON_ID=582737 /ORGANISM="Tetraselmis sp., Strain GSL018" /LENGTH=311 /DNA_ID=CAMNT_0019096809 /DNA_START=178 /DNA_END=1113 /DNA_ORIENTATION=+